ncbi:MULTISPECIES: MBL fold metallo-hydrolase [unclassified Nocardia]|uniref:MBL fold metallo-hydrolase n=1 Tax=unclassified Nocardia TaxID=2637762 RepID=UPI0033AE96BB
MKLIQVTTGVHMVTGTNVNWALVDDGDALTVIDAGYPNDGNALVASIQAIGRRPEDVRAIVLTHAHLDHMGGIPTLRAGREIPVLTGPEEARHARREYLEQITPGEMFQQCGHIAGVRWVVQTFAAALPHLKMSIPDVTAVPHDVPLDIPGALVPVSTPGHTSGHTAWLMPSTGVVFTGDALVTDHPLSHLECGPQLLPSVFNEDEDVMTQSLSTLAGLAADTVIPGHGPLHRGPIERLVDQAVHTKQAR